MAQSIKGVFDEVASHVSIDAALIKRIHDYERAFVNRNEDHIAFFGSPLMGVHTLRFRPSDRESWFNDVLDIDEISLVDGIKSLASIPEEWKRANDVMNQSCIRLVYAIQNSPELNAAQKHQGSIDALLVLLYKFMGSLMHHNYPFPANEALMLAAYAKLNKKFAIKQAGSWGALFRLRAEQQLSPNSIHRRAYLQMDRDIDVIAMISDIQSRLRELVKSYNKVIYQVKEEGGAISSERSVMDMDGTAVLKDRARQQTTYIRYAHEVIGGKASWIRADLVRVICDAMHTMSPRLFEQTLEWMSLNHRVRGAVEVEKLIDETLIFTFDLMERERDIVGPKMGLLPLITRLRALYMASRMSDDNLIRTKELSEAIVAKAVSSRNQSVIASVRTGIQLYIVLRTLAMNYYQR